MRILHWLWMLRSRRRPQGLHSRMSILIWKCTIMSIILVIVEVIVRDYLLSLTLMTLEIEIVILATVCIYAR